MNKALLVGRITTKPELRTTSSGIPFTRFSVAINRPFTNNGESTISNINSVAQTVTAAEFNSDAFKSLSSGYNEADYMIGTKIAYFMIEVTVEPAA